MVKYGHLGVDNVGSMRTSFGLMIAAAAFLASACVVSEVPAAPVDDPKLVLGQQLFAGNCASCHGRQGQGGRGEQLNEGRVDIRYPDIQDQIDLVTNGKGAMPSFARKFTPEQIDAVVAYTREVL